VKTLIVGGDIKTQKPSSIIHKLSEEFRDVNTVLNGTLPKSITGYDLTLWFPNIPNEEEKNYPVKDKGSVLICSKVIREGRTEVDAVSRIFDIHGNAVVCIYKHKHKNFSFQLIDALGNSWVHTDSLRLLLKSILEFYEWSKGQIRMSFIESTGIVKPSISLPKQFVELNTKVADKIESKLGARYFGNFSTRCMKLFPSIRQITHDTYLFSPRNIDKKRLSTEDFVLVTPPYYYGNRMYSVDSPCQMYIYRQFDDINYMIHGHAYIKHAKFTESYYPCGDLREVEEIAKLFRTGARVINLKNHGFLIAAEDLRVMEYSISSLEFIPNSLLTGEK